MIRFLELCSWGILILLFSNDLRAQVPIAPVDAGQIYRRSSPAVVLIQTPNKQGSGFLVSSDGRILTNFHVIAQSKEATVRLSNGDAYDDVEVLSVDRRKDIALIKIKATELSSVTLGRSSSVEVGSTVYTVGNPQGLQNTLSQGLVSGVRQFDGYQYFQISAPISPGSSGGPVMSIAGDVIGIVVASIEQGQNLNFAIPIDYAKGMLNSNQAQPLAAFYEPEPQAEVNATTKSTEGGVPLPPEASKNLAAFLISKLGKWKSQDALSTLGKPLREYTTEGANAMKKYEYGDSTNLWRGIRLTFEQGSDTLIAVATYPWNMTITQMKVLWGENFNTYKIEKEGLIMYVYVDRALLVSANDLGAVDSITTYVPGLQPLANLGLSVTDSQARPIRGGDAPSAESSDAILDVNPIKGQLGMMTSDEAISKFGQPFRRYLLHGKKRSDDLDICYFVDRTRTVRRIMLAFSADSKRLDSIALYPYSLKASELVAELGSNYKSERGTGDLSQYVYKNKPVILFVRPNDDVFSINVTRSSPAWRVLTGEEARNDWRLTLNKPTHNGGLQTSVSVRGPGAEFSQGRNERILRLERNLGTWTLDDGRREFGPVATQASRGDRSNNTDIDQFGFQDATGAFVLVSLSFYRASGKLASASLSPAGMKGEQLIEFLGGDFLEEKDPTGNRVYKYRDRPMAATLDNLGNVIAILISVEI